MMINKRVAISNVFIVTLLFHEFEGLTPFFFRFFLPVMTINVHIRLSQICTFLPNNFFPKKDNFIPLFGSKALQKTENWKFLCIFSLTPSPLKFYYITHYVKWSYQENLNFFQFFITKLYFFLLNLNSLWKMCSFEVHHVDIAQKLRNWEGEHISWLSYNCSLWAPLQLS